MPSFPSPGVPAKRLVPLLRLLEHALGKCILGLSEPKRSVDFHGRSELRIAHLQFLPVPSYAAVAHVLLTTDLMVSMPDRTAAAIRQVHPTLRVLRTAPAQADECDQTIPVANETPVSRQVVDCEQSNNATSQLVRRHARYSQSGMPKTGAISRSVPQAGGLLASASDVLGIAAVVTVDALWCELKDPIG